LFAAYRNFNLVSLGCAAEGGVYDINLNRRFALAECQAFSSLLTAISVLNYS
jgi:hypothetical protein